MKPILEINNVSKKFRINHETEPYLSLRDSLMALFRSRRETREDFWALKNLDFHVNKGESIGIIGKNGAGKSTLLKILSKITPPSSGRIISRGRIASLLEVGTGFHPELTGRENIFLNGSILGLKRREISSGFDEIVDFSGVEKFLDTPLKHYSSGMQLRLAFSVAAFLRNEILIIDEVLAVGDAEFQRKCMGKMEDVSRSGRTILFVSHNMGAVKNLCTRCILLDHGRVEKDGKAEEVIETYISGVSQFSSNRRKVIESPCKRVSLKLPFWVNEKGSEVSSFAFGEKMFLRFEFQLHEKMKGINPGMAVLSREGIRIFTSHLVDDKNCVLPASLEGQISIDTELCLPELSPGTYQVIFGARDDKGNSLIQAEDATEVILQIEETNKQKEAANGILWHTGNWRLVNS